MWIFHQLLNNVCICGVFLMFAIVYYVNWPCRKRAAGAATGSRLWFAWLICYSWILHLLRLPKETVQESVSGSKNPTWNLDLWLEDNLRIDLSLFISLDASLTPTEIRAIGSISLALLFYAGWVANWTDRK